VGRSFFPPFSEALEEKSPPFFVPFGRLLSPFFWPSRLASHMKVTLFFPLFEMGRKPLPLFFSFFPFPRAIKASSFGRHNPSFGSVFFLPPHHRLRQARKKRDTFFFPSLWYAEGERPIHFHAPFPPLSFECVRESERPNLSFWPLRRWETNPSASFSPPLSLVSWLFSFFRGHCLF